MKKYVMGIDLGTTGSKAMVIDLRGKMLGSAYADYPFIHEQDNWVELDANDMTEKILDVTESAVKMSGVDPADIAAVSFSVQRSSFLLVDAKGKSINNRVVTWLDTRSEETMEKMRSQVDPVETETVTGMPVTPIYGLEKFYWYKEKQPEVYEKAYYYATVDGYIMNLFGSEQFCNEVTGLQAGGMIDVHTMDYCFDIMERLGLDRKKLPRLARPGEVMGYINEATSKRTGLTTDTLIVAGSGDQQAGAVGAGVIESGDLSITMGTGGFVIAATDSPQFDKLPGLMVSCTPAPALNTFEVEGIQSSGATCYRWARDVFFSVEAQVARDLGMDEYDLMNQYVSNSKPGSNGLIFNASLFGTGYPTWNSGATGSFVGLRSTHTRSDILRAVMEGITLEARFMLESMKETGVHVKDICTITGGATKSPVWRQIMADVWGVRCRTLDVSDAAVLGVAGLAAIGAGLYHSLEEVVENMVHFKEEVEPNPKNVEVYNKVFQAYKTAYYALHDSHLFEMVNDIARGV